MSHPTDVVVLFPSLLRALARGCEVLSEAGLDVYLHEGRWYWQWASLQVRSEQSFETLDGAFAAALEYCISPQVVNGGEERSQN